MACVLLFVLGWEAGMQIVYERCAAVDVGKDVIAVAARLPGERHRHGPDVGQRLLPAAR